MGKTKRTKLFDKLMNDGITTLHKKAKERSKEAKGDAEEKMKPTATLADMPKPVFAKAVSGVGAALLLSVLVIVTYRITMQSEAFALFVLPIYFALGSLQVYLSFKRGRIYSYIGVCRSPGGGAFKNERVRTVSFDVKEENELIRRTYRVFIKKGEFGDGLPYRLYFNRSNPSALFAWENAPLEEEKADGTSQ